MMKRPVLHAAIAFGAGILTAWYIRQVFFIMVHFLLILILYCYGVSRKLFFSKFLLVWSVAFFSGYLNYALQYTVMLQPVTPLYDSSVTIAGYVSSDCTIADGRAAFDLFAETVQTQNGTEKLCRNIRINVLNAGEKQDFYPGTYLEVTGTLEKPSRSRNPGGFDYESWMFSKKVPSSMWVHMDEVHHIGCVKSLPILRFSLAVRQHISSSLARNLSAEKAALAEAMLTGYKENLTEPMKEAFSAAGLSHIMAVSGANLAFLLLPLLWLFRKLGFHRKAGAIASIPFILVYILITGMEASVLRASVMALVMLAGKALDRKADLLNSLGIASLILLAVNPFMLFDVGFLLSFGATAGLALLYRRVFAIIPAWIPGFIRETLAATVSAQAGVFPLLIHYFSKISLISLISNLIVVPLTGITTVLGMLVVLADSIHGILGLYGGYMLQGLLHIILYTTDVCASIPWAEVNMHHWNTLWITIYYGILIFVGVFGIQVFTRFKGVTTACTLLIGTVLLIQGLLPGRLKVIFTDVGQGDSALIQTAEGKAYMIDGGGKHNEAETGYTGRQILLPMLMHEGVSSLEQVIVSHAHTDHMSGVLTLLECFPVKSVGLPDYPEAPSDFSELLEICLEKKIPVNYYSNGDTVTLDNRTHLRILGPDQGSSVPADDLNNSSLCGLVCYNHLQILFTGDLETKREKAFIALNQPMDCDILKVAHHGGKNATSEEFLENTLPDVAVISVGQNNYGHPSEEVLNRLSFGGVKVYTTLRSGAIIVDSDGSRYWITPWCRDEQFTFLN